MHSTERQRQRSRCNRNFASFHTNSCDIVVPDYTKHNRPQQTRAYLRRNQITADVSSHMFSSFAVASNQNHKKKNTTATSQTSSFALLDVVSCGGCVSSRLLAYRTYVRRLVSVCLRFLQTTCFKRSLCLLVAHAQ